MPAKHWNRTKTRMILGRAKRRVQQKVRICQHGYVFALCSRGCRDPRKARA